MSLCKPARHDLEFGDQFGYWTVIEFSHPDANSGRMWICECVCGKRAAIPASKLVRGRARGCASCSRCGPNTYFFPIWYFRKIKSSAEKRGLKFDLTEEYLDGLARRQQGHCALSGLELSFGKIHLDKMTASLDRIDSNKGYVRGNVQWVHADINLMKNVFSQRYFVEMCRFVATKHKGERSCP